LLEIEEAISPSAKSATSEPGNEENKDENVDAAEEERDPKKALVLTKEEVGQT
jgi:hypothetical protein